MSAADTIKNVILIVPVVGTSAPGPASKVQSCLYYRADPDRTTWVPVTDAPIEIAATQATFTQPSADDAARHVVLPPGTSLDREAFLFAAAAKTLRTTTDQEKVFLAATDSSGCLGVKIPVAGLTTRGVILIFTRPGTGANVTDMSSTADPEISNSTDNG